MASPLEHFVVGVRNFSSQGNFDQLQDHIAKNTDVLLKNGPLLEDVMQTLDLQEHSLGILAILTVKFNLPNVDFETLFVQVQEFVSGCNGEQIRMSREAFSNLCHNLTQSLIERHQAIRGIDILTKAINKVQLHQSQFTSIHSDLCQLCLVSKCVKPALAFLDVDVTEISREGSQLNEGHDVKYFLQYYYYGGIIYAILKNYERSIYFFQVALTTPSMAISHIMLESYKKYILVSLILYGKVPSLPKYTSQVISRFIKPLSQPYTDLASAYASNNVDEIAVVINKHNDVYTRDVNMGLVKQCLASLHKKNIQRLTKTFMTLSLVDMANKVQLPSAKDAEKHIINMIEDGEIFASINQKDGMVVFLDNPEKYNSAAMYKQIEDEMRKCIQLEEKLRKMDQDIAVNPKYIQKISRENE